MPWVSVEDFAAHVRSAREEQRLSRSDLARLSGVSASQIEKLEGRNPPDPKRPTVIDLAHALGLDIDRWLATLGHEPLSETARERLPKRDDPWPDLVEMWPRLTPAQKQAIVGLIRSFVGAKGRPNGEEGSHDVTVVRLGDEGTPETSVKKRNDHGGR